MVDAQEPDLVGFQQQLPSGTWSSTLGAVVDSGFSPVDAVSCSDVPISMDAVRTGDAYLVATSSAPLIASECAGGSPLELRLFRHQAPSLLEPLVAITETAPVHRVALAAHDDGGAWLVWQRRNAEVPLEVYAARIDASGNLGAPAEVAPAAEVDGPFSVTSLGDRLVIAWVETRAATPSIALRVHADDAEPAALSFGPDLAGQATGELALLASPTQTAFLLAWASSSTDVEQVAGLDVARFDCLPP